MESSAPDRRQPPWLALLLLLTFLVYSPSLVNGFTYDDAVYVKTDRTDYPPNIMVEAIRPLREYFEREMGYDGAEMRGRGFRPFTVLSYAVVHALSKSSDPSLPRGHEARAWLQHLVNVLLHVLSVWLVFLVIASFTGRGWSALFGALVFGLQPLHTDVVASIVGRGELLAFVFGAIGLLLYLRAATVSGIAVACCQAGAAAALFLSFGSKESAITWAVFVPLFTWMHDWHRAPERGLVGSFLAQRTRIFAVAVPIAIWAWLYLGFLAGLSEEFQVPYEFNPLYYAGAAERLPPAVMILGYGLSKIFFSVMLASDYGDAVFDTGVGWADWRFLLGLGFVLALLGMGIAAFRTRPLAFLGVAALLGFSFVTSNIPVSIETIFGERLLFTPSLGLSLLVAAIVGSRLRDPLRKILIVVLGLWCLWGVRWCIERSLSWHDNNSLMLADVEHQPRSLSINKQVAFYYKKRGDPARWMEYQQHCLDLDPHYIMVLNDLGAHYLQQGDHDRARGYLDRALRALDLRPRYKVVQGDVVHLNLGRWNLIRGNRKVAIQHFQKARGFNRRNPHPRIHLLMIAHQDRDDRLAEELLQEFDEYQPMNPYILMHRGLQAWRRGDFAVAARALYEALYHHDLARNRQDLDAWRACEDAFGKLGRRAEQAKVLESMMRLFPHQDRAPVAKKLVAVLRRLLTEAPAEDRAALAKRIEELQK